ncbi:phospholipid/cholesterol/gamma-HCH transport system substrate-binding protein [Nocardioides sp. J9]|uniref:MCE family protein n=1 Tax=Nocardioides sp. J9 TaxID=935844 RepID=UPI0011AA07CF|nr:MCE family protein [Nocardioides sp. J9]TWG94924.1 phospholipid/cholesterol/gamma-HCH transport system substrate-binding protein [Nocardioides sp. J9]
MKDRFKGINQRWTRVAVAAAVVVGALGALGMRGGEQTNVTVWFERTDAIYAGDEVRVLGVPVGRVDEIKPMDGKVRVKLHVDGDVKIPADAKAALVAPSLVSSRYIQLAPRYDGGEVLADGAEIPIERSVVPVEWDEIKEQVNDLVEALGPRGANKNGALSEFIDTGADLLEGQGQKINQTIADMAEAIQVFDRGSDDFFSLVKNLEVFVKALASSDEQMKLFIRNLDAVSEVLSQERKQIRPALAQLDDAVKDVERFVGANRGTLDESITRLTDVMSVVNKQQVSLAQILHVAPNALENITEAYHKRQNAIGVNLGAPAVLAPGQLICGGIGGVIGGKEKETQEACNKLIGGLLDDVASTPEVRKVLDTLLVLLAGGAS